MNTPPDSIRVVGEADLLELARVARGTWNGWIRSGHVCYDESGLYTETDLVELVALIGLNGGFPMAKAVAAWRGVQSEFTAIALAAAIEEAPTIDLVVDQHTLDASVATTAEVLFDLVHIRAPSPRPRVVLTLGEVIHEARDAFWRRARPGKVFAQDRRRKASARPSPNVDAS